MPVEALETTTPLVTFTITSIAFISGFNYNVFFNITGTVDDLFYRYRLQGATPWIAGSVIGDGTSPFEIELNVSSGTYEIQIYGYDNINAQNVYSNIFTKVI